MEQIIIAGGSHPALAQSVADTLDVPCTLANTKRFPDQELKIEVPGDFQGKELILFQSTMSPSNDYLMELLLLADMAIRADARFVSAVIPYFGYGRQDRVTLNHGAISAHLVARLLKTAGIDKIITCDLHSAHEEAFFEMPLLMLDLSSLLMNSLETHSIDSVVAPDCGRLKKAGIFADQLDVPLVALDKTRKDDGLPHISKVTHDVKGMSCLIVEDIIDTGNTLLKAAQALIKAGAKSVTVAATHAVLSGNALTKLGPDMFTAIYVCDTIPQPNLPDHFRVCPTSKALASALRKSDKDVS